MHRDGEVGPRRPLRLAIFGGDLSAAGGAERVVFEEAAALRRAGHEVVIIAFAFAASVTFTGHYTDEVVVLRSATGGRIRSFLTTAWRVLTFLRRWRPDLVIAMSSNDCARLYLPSLLTRTQYVVHINGTQFWFPPEQDLTKYSWRYRGVMRAILERNPRNAELVPPDPPPVSALTRVRLESTALLHWFAVRRARRRISFSRRMAWEVELLYRRPALVLKGAFPAAILEHEPASDPVAAHRIDGGPVVLNVNRLEPRKRIRHTIESFALVLEARPDAVLLVGGRGPSEDEAHALVESLGLQERVRFLGFVAEQELWDLLATCDAFVHPNWAEFAIAPYEALALGANVVWTDEMEMEPSLEASAHLFAAEPDPDAMAAAILRALDAPKATPAERRALAEFTWEHYFEQLERVLLDTVAEREPGAR